MQGVNPWLLLTSTPMKESGFLLSARDARVVLPDSGFLKRSYMGTRSVRRLFLGEKKFQILHLQN